MSFTATTTAIQKFFKDGWATQSRTETILYRGYTVPDADDPAKGSAPWARLFTNETVARKITLGDTNSKPRFRYSGVITVHVQQRAGTGTKTIEEMADDVKAIFLQFAIDDADAGYIRNAPGTSPQFRFAGVVPQGWERGIMTIPYIRDVLELNT